MLFCRYKSANIHIFDQPLCSVDRNPPRFQTSTPMRKHGPTTCLAWTPAGVLTLQLLPCSHGRTAAIVRPTPAQKVSQQFEIQNVTASAMNLYTSFIMVAYGEKYFLGQWGSFASIFQVHGRTVLSAEVKHFIVNAAAVWSVRVRQSSCHFASLCK